MSVRFFAKLFLTPNLKGGLIYSKALAITYMTGLHVDVILIISYLLQYLDTIRIVTHQMNRYLFRYCTL